MAQIINPYRLALPPVFPNDFAGLIRWYKADTFSLADSDAIGGVGREWIDQSPTAPNDATQATPGDRPLYRTNIFGAMPAIQFSGHLLVMPGMVLSGDFTIVSIAKSGSDSILFGITTANNWIRFHVADTELDFYDGVNNPQSNIFTTIFNQVNMSSWRRGGGTFTYRERDIARGDFVCSVVNKTWDQFGGTLGTGITDMHIGEVCVWNTRLSDANIDLLYTNYFKTRWGLP